MEQFKYEIGDKVYIQRPLVLGQRLQLFELLKDFQFPKDFNALKIINILGNKQSKSYAIVVIPEGVQINDKNIEDIAKELEGNLEFDTEVKIIEDFFVCNLISSRIERIGKMILNITGKISEPSLKNLSASSPEEISQKEILSSGDIPSENASLISNSDREK